MARKRNEELHAAVERLAPTAAPWTPADQQAAASAYQRLRGPLERLRRGVARTGIAYWRWVLEQAAQGRRVPKATLEFARSQVEQESREPGQDDEERAA